MIVSLEAIFLSTFVLISQNRADPKRQVIADQEWKTVEIATPAPEATPGLDKRAAWLQAGRPKRCAVIVRMWRKDQGDRRRLRK
jgi:hypothetical protein